MAHRVALLDNPAGRVVNMRRGDPLRGHRGLPPCRVVGIGRDLCSNFYRFLDQQLSVPAARADGLAQPH